MGTRNPAPRVLPSGNFPPVHHHVGSVPTLPGKIQGDGQPRAATWVPRIQRLGLGCPTLGQHSSILRHPHQGQCDCFPRTHLCPCPAPVQASSVVRLFLGVLFCLPRLGQEQSEKTQLVSAERADDFNQSNTPRRVVGGILAARYQRGVSAPPATPN